MHLEAWIFFAVIIMANCKKPLESALKTFVFFLISQPLIYLFQVPFSWQGWGLFAYYKTWFIWTILTFPMAFVGWYITKKNWLSVLIFAPVLGFLGYVALECGSESLSAFPHLLVAALFCILQIVLYVLVFFPDVRQKLVGFAIPVIVIVVFALITPRICLAGTEPLPGDPTFSEDATVTVDDRSIADMQIHSPEQGIVYVNAHDLGTTGFTVRDGDAEYRYSLEIYRENGVVQTRITPIE